MILYGQPVADKIFQKITQNVQKAPSKPGLAVILVGNNPASEVYVGTKVKRAQELGMNSKAYRLPSDVEPSRVLELVQTLNLDPETHGILLQLPLPKHLDADAIISTIAPEKDVDGLTPINMGKLLSEIPGGFVPCTPAGVVEILNHYSIPVEGKHVAILGRSNIVGKPLAALMMQKHALTNASVTVLHSKSENIKEILLSADIIVSAIGSPFFLKGDMVSSKSVVIDVGISKIPDEESPKGYRIVGDVDFNNVVTKCAAITPVPGGVGPTTVAMLMRNTWESYQKLEIFGSSS
ncbi:tetrahydrofolate dehydrogenase/cyclohydrolase catalytic domain-containing protein [Chlamydiifrater phoenicopteri]|uniref:tetrahydrofolate dehydrogenase/cyclohydrolase catalytic domain-containing protein n=1 Tax=Chlamydiifrater phoenicopteri TaxID=2681469 RepID=UPI001BD03807|nr:tetrahydrofolate dehydrogenase/cyclohydrolase catalytic domain-containing protein [Chlamydiifrater phoenicopteri]